MSDVQRIMRRVYLVWCLRRLTGPTACKLVASGLLAWALINRVSVASVAANAQHFGTWLEQSRYLVSAFSNTELIVQSLSAGLVLVAAWWASDGLKLLWRARF